REFLVVVLSAPYGLLAPNATQHAHLQGKRKRDADEAPAAPPEFYALYDPKRFALVRADEKSFPALAIAPLPHAFRKAGGLSTSTMVELSTSMFHQPDRSLIAVAWELPAADVAGPYQVRIDKQAPVSVPAIELKNYRGRHRRSSSASSTADSGLLGEEH